MNCPSRTEEPEGTGFNQNPGALSADLTTRNDLNGMANTRVLRRIPSSEIRTTEEQDHDPILPPEKGLVVGEKRAQESRGGGGGGGGGMGPREGMDDGVSSHHSDQTLFIRVRKFCSTFSKFIGPGFMVIYICPTSLLNSANGYQRSLWLISIRATMQQM